MERGDPDARPGNAATAEIATVFARTPDGGGVYATFAFDAHGNSRNHPTGSGILGDPDRSLIAMRLPWFAEQNTLLQVIAPSTATVAELTRDEVVIGSVNLVNGVGSVRLPSPSTVTVTAYDAAGKVVAKRDFADWEENMTDMYEPELRGW